ncbi:hypothetical protein GSI_04676 [Ganoderma sinense ZZ0214-1]|uniref:Uncharacterized protein n=1 Tax=Ganoderma sinense ZZ0214-1 TaxID=1077348 RepID=A0A2G8SHI4_9APHY|nr:hypothetical protein GSI_04676 [Ganoderma sinense ZZ0214-1]
MTTSAEFWKHFEHWELPIGLPHFFSRSAVTSELFDFIVEMRLKSTSAGLAENVKQFHLLEYHRRHYEYLHAYQARTKRMSFEKQKPLVPFSKPLVKKVGKQTGGYDNRSISNDLITAILLKLSNKTRIEESEEHMRTLNAVAISVDTTFRCAYKATLVDKNKAHVQSHLGGFVSVLNEKSQPISWLCHSQSQMETQEMLAGIANQLEILELPPLEIMTADNCCQVRNSAQKVFPDIDVVQDVWHFLMQYVACIQDGTKNPYQGQVANDIVDAILKAKAANGVPAIYRPQAEQEQRLVEVYNKWKEHGGMWTAVAEKVHAKQLTHVQKDCLTRPRDDIVTDSSRIEGSHKGWNSIMCAFASGLEVMNALGHDHILHHNVRIDMQDDSLDKSMFMYHTYGSHHIRLMNACAKLWNTLVEAEKKKGLKPANLRALPVFCPADSREKFALVKMSAETATQYSLTTIKQEPGDESLVLSSQDVLDPDRILKEIGIDPTLLNTPLESDTPEQRVDASLTCDSKGKGVKRTREEDSEDEIVELSQAEWRVPAGWFPAAQSTMPTLQAALATAGTSTLFPASNVSVSNAVATVLTMTSTSSANIPTYSALPAISAVAPFATSSTLSLTPSATAPSAASSALPLIPSAAIMPAASSVLAAAPSTISNASASGALTTTMSAISSAAPSAAPNASTSSAPGALTTMTSGTSNISASTPPAPPMIMLSPSLNGPPPKKKSCLSVAGMPTPSKSMQNNSNQPKQYNQLQNNPGTLNAMFSQASQATTGNASTGVSPSALTPTNELCLPRPAIVGLTRSQRLFSVITQVDPRSLTFGSGASSREFFLFMSLWATHRWATFQMSPYDWVCAASTYNTAIKDLNHEHRSSLPFKTPRALLDKLSEVEGKIFVCIRDSNYCSRSGGTAFWEHHCKAVYLGAKIQRMIDDTTFKMGKNHVCGRCKRIMYPEEKNHKGANHSRKICSDGVRQTAEKVHLTINGISRDFLEQPPPFPQPNDIFTNGDVFHPARFMEFLTRFYDRVVVNQSTPGALAMTDHTFAALLYDRTVVVPGLDGRPSKYIFKLFHSFKLAPGEAVVLDEHDGETYLRMDCLSEPPLEVLQDNGQDNGLSGSA